MGEWILCCELEVTKPGMRNNGMVGEWSICCKSEVTKPGIAGSRWGWGGGDKSYFILLSVRIHQARKGGGGWWVTSEVIFQIAVSQNSPSQEWGDGG